MSALRTVFGLLLPGGAFHTLQYIGVIHDVGYPFSAAMALVEFCSAFVFPRQQQLLFGSIGPNRFCGASNCARKVAEKLIPIAAGLGYHFVMRGQPFLHGFEHPLFCVTVDKTC